MAACMADNALSGEVIGLVWDGTGYGTDGTTWGGECLVGGYDGFSRVGSIRPIPLVGGDLVTKEPLRVAWALRRDAGLPTEEENGALYETMLQSGLNCPLSSGMGRLFDGVSAMIGVKTRCSYEGQGAILLEAAATDDDGLYPIAWEEENGLLRFDWRESIRAIADDQSRGTDRGVIAARFMNTLADMGVRQCIRAREQSGLERVVLSGGSFQNMYMMHRLPEALRRAGFTVYHHRRVSTNDEGISLGQLLVARAVLERK